MESVRSRMLVLKGRTPHVTYATCPFFLTLLFTVFCSAACFAQIDRAEVNGTVTDARGAALSGVNIQVTQEGTNAIRKVVSNQKGQFVASSLPYWTLHGRDATTELQRSPRRRYRSPFWRRAYLERTVADRLGE